MEYKVVVILKHGTTLIRTVKSVDPANAIIEALEGLTRAEKDKVTGVRIG